MNVGVKNIAGSIVADESGDWASLGSAIRLAAQRAAMLHAAGGSAGDRLVIDESRPPPMRRIGLPVSARRQAR